MSFFTMDLLEGFMRTMHDPTLFLSNYAMIAETKHFPRLGQAIKACCANSIGQEYLNQQKLNLNTHPETFDLVLVTDRPLYEVKMLPTSVRGFMIVQKGECVKMPEVYSVNLVCSQHSKGSALIACYLYCINNHPELTVKMGILELANGYFNVGGLCLYSKYGFEFDITMYGKDCFESNENLPMIVDIANKYGYGRNCNQKIKNIYNGTVGFPKPFICSLRGKRQQILGLAMNVELLVTMQLHEHLIPFDRSDGIVLLYDVFYKEFMHQNDEEVHRFIQSIESISEAEIDAMVSRCILFPISQAPQPTSAPSFRVTRSRMSAGKKSIKKRKRRY